MYTEADLQSAVAAGALSHEAAEALRAHAAGMRSAPIADEEQFRLINGFNDIFVTIAAILLLAAAYRLCRTAAGADRQTERYARQWKEEHHGK